MSKSVKAALLSAFVIPGAGHILLKRTMTGITLIAASVVALYIILLPIIERAQQVVEQIKAGYISSKDYEVIGMMMAQPADSDSLVRIATIALAVIWIIGIGHSYLLGREE
ncbi:MAG: hypothetical protein QS721_12910 [Candidatus Endonucleobacter sp. (ex Gigantidas childressi)]|nr:hypothetical protein [Candidatus Endonucleobacter sp. (ex Gigantidas childressi)]